MTAALRFRNLTLGYDLHPAVHHLDGSVARGDFPDVRAKAVAGALQHVVAMAEAGQVPYAAVADTILAQAEALIQQPGPIVTTAIDIERRWKALDLADDTEIVDHGLAGLNGPHIGLGDRGVNLHPT